MRRFSMVWMVLFACGHKAEKAPEASGDCAVVAKDPAGAMKTLSDKYPKDPVKVAETIEKCIAPSGDDCERLAKIVTAIPGMTGGGKEMKADSVLEACKGMPDAMRKCMLPSYSLGHVDECKDVYAKVADSALNANAGEKKPCEGGVVSAKVLPDGVWISAADGKECWGARAGGSLDAAWIEKNLKQFVGGACNPVFEISAAKDAGYGDVIAVMDLATKSGLVEVAFSDESTLTHKPAGEAQKAPAECEKVAATGTAKHAVVPPNDAASLPPMDLTGPNRVALPEKEQLQKLPILIITKTDLMLKDKKIGDVKAIADGTGDIEELEAALPASPTDHRVILQADTGTPGAVIARVIATAKAAGYDDVLFAVKNK